MCALMERPASNRYHTYYVSVDTINSFIKSTRGRMDNAKREEVKMGERDVEMKKWHRDRVTEMTA